MWNQLLMASGGMVLLGLVLGFFLRQEQKSPADSVETCAPPSGACTSCGARTACAVVVHH